MIPIPAVESGQKNNSNPVLLRGWLATAVICHAIVSLWHGVEHIHARVSLTTMQQVFIGVVVGLLPLVGMAMLWAGNPRKKRGGVWLIMISMFASLVFGFLNHFVLSSPDYVLSVPMQLRRHGFVLSAALLVVTETVGTLIGIVALLRLPARA